ncbi:MAG: TIGR02587 family membrane protein [Hymenobacteraceae bacterium]|nr:TIGR02587 family membrane protein [Hymenobacteraceae bacterium]
MAQIKGGRPLRKSLKEYARGLVGGLLFSFPLLYTMEVWWAGFIVDSLDLLILVLVTFLLLLGYNRFAGMHPGVSWASVFIDSIEELGIGLLVSFGVLLMLNRIHLYDMSVDEAMGKIIIEAMGVSIGVSIGTAQLGVHEEELKGTEESPNRNTTLAMFVLAFCGAIVIGGNVAPTEEVLLIAVEAEPVHILMMCLVSLFVSTVVVYFSDFVGSSRGRYESLLYDISFNTCLSYVTALAASAFILWFFGRFEGVSFWVGFAQVIVLGVLASLGASAGRLLIK